MIEVTIDRGSATFFIDTDNNKEAEATAWDEFCKLKYELRYDAWVADSRVVTK